MAPDKVRLPRHKRVESPPRIKLTERDAQVILAVYEYRLLRREQIERLFFPSPNTANERLKRLYQHGFLERRWLPVEYGQGTGQAIYLLAERGADLAAERLGLDRGAVDWKESYNQVSTPFLEHALGVNQARIAFTLAAHKAGYQIGKWIGEGELKARPDYVQIPTASGVRRKIAVIPDGYFVLVLGEKRAHFFLESDRATEANKRWGEKVQAYLEYTRSGKYTERYGTRSLRVLTVTTGEKRLANLKRATEQAGGREMFWFTTVAEAQPEGMVGKPIWQVAGQEELQTLI
jgi:hypothetical protein